MPQAGVQDLRDKILEAMQKLSARKRVIIFGCHYGIDVTRLARAGIVGINLECIGMLPASFIDYALRQGADGVFITGCRMGDCYHRLGNQFLLQRLDGERKPKLSRRVVRERIKFLLAAQADQIKLLNELELFYRSLPPSNAVKDDRHTEKGPKRQ
jgi:coenzyme F420-reducing hydrogenase delta subunit